MALGGMAWMIFVLCVVVRSVVVTPVKAEARRFGLVFPSRPPFSLFILYLDSSVILSVSFDFLPFHHRQIRSTSTSAPVSFYYSLGNRRGAESSAD